MVIERMCPTNDCGKSIEFKLTDTENTTKKFCLECLSRLQYDRKKDIVSVIEKLTVPKSHLADFIVFLCIESPSSHTVGYSVMAADD